MEKVVQNKWNNQLYTVLNFNDNKTVTIRKPNGDVITIELKEFRFTYRELRDAK